MKNSNHPPDNPMKTTKACSAKNTSEQLKTGLCSNVENKGDSAQVLPFITPLKREQHVRSFLGLHNELEELALKNQYAREIRANHRSVTGWINGDFSHDSVPFESTLERDLAYRSLFCDHTQATRAQPFTLTYQNADGDLRKYTPDFALDYFDNDDVRRTVVIEVKYEADWQEKQETLQPAYDAMSDWASDNGQEFYLLTETHIRTAAIDNIKALFPFRFLHSFDDTRASSIYMEIKDALPMTNREILDFFSKNRSDRAEIQAHLWELLAVGRIRTDMDRAFDQDTLFQHNRTFQAESLFFKKGITFR